MYVKIHSLNESVICLILRVRLCAPGQEREQRGSSYKKVKVRADGVRVENGGRGMDDHFPYPTTYTLVHGCVEGDWSKSGAPWHPEFMLCAFVCEHVCVIMHICKCMNVCTREWTRCTHAQVCVCVCAHVYIFGCTT